MRLALIALLFVTAAPMCAVAQTSSGTAFVVAAELLITNHHVVGNCSSIEVITPDGRRSVDVADMDAQLDLALLRVSGLKSQTARIRVSPRLRLGESVMVFGFPLSGSLSSRGNFTSGNVSGLLGLRDAAGIVQITAPVQPGNSGGPLLDSSGMVVGVVRSKLNALRSAITTGDIPQNVNFAISQEVLADFLTKNNVPFDRRIASSQIDQAGVAELAQSFTFLVECHGRSQQAMASPKLNPTSPQVERSNDLSGAFALELPNIDRRTAMTRIEDEGISLRAAHRINERFREGINLTVATFNRSVLLAGQVPDLATKEAVEKIAASIDNVRGISNQIDISDVISTLERTNDSDLISRLKHRFSEAGGFDTAQVSLVTSKGSVFLIGIVTKEEAAAATDVVRRTTGVRKVVRLFEYCDVSRSSPCPR